MQRDPLHELAVPDFAMRNEAQVWEDALDEAVLDETRGFRGAWRDERGGAGLAAHPGQPGIPHFAD